jgi:Fe2+ or Zn2+ uptake regulation protein
MATVPTPTIPGLPPGVLPAVLTILGRSSAPIRRRKLLEELERRGHRVSLAGLNRVLQQCTQSGLTDETEEGVRLRAAPRELSRV